MNRRAQALHGIAFLLAACLVQAEPFGYVVNSDSLSDTDFDQLYRVDLATGNATLIGPVGYGDVEGLALSPDGVLYGVDDNTETLITIDAQTGQGSPVDNTTSNLTLGPDGLELGASYDFGLTFDAAGRLWLSSDVTGEQWRVDPATGRPQLVAGSAGSSVITASGDGEKSHAVNQPHLTGLAACGNARYGITVTSPASLYKLTPQEVVGALTLGAGFDDGGLDFDATGTLWGISDRSRVGNDVLDEPSIIFRVERSSGAATRVATTIVGVESLAIAPPGPCPEEQASSHAIPTGSPTGLLLMIVGLSLGAGLALRDRGVA